MTSDFEQRVRASFDRQGFMHHLGARLASVAAGECVIEVPFDPRLGQQHGFFHGGVTATLADNAAGFAGFTLMDPDEQPLSVEFKISFVAPAIGELLRAKGRVVRAGRRLKHTQVEVFAVRNGEESSVALALATIAGTRSVAELEPGASVR